jgi:ferric-dicitrate binding protein FerR (iron transport regulator)
MENDAIYNLTHKKLTGQITGAELLQLEELSRVEENKILINNIEQTWTKSAEIEEMTFDHSSAYNTFLSKIGESPAAEVPHEAKVFNFTKYATAIAAVFVLGLFVINVFKADMLSHSYEEGAIVTLEDNSKIYLSKGSLIDYPSNFNNDRSVKLTGKAVFEVAKNTDSKFTVQAGNTRITVLGTTFSVETNDQYSKQVKVIEGKVQVDHEKKVIVISDRESVSIEDGKDFVKEENISFAGNDVYKPVLVYANSPLSKVLTDLEVKFNIEFDVKSRTDYSKCKFTSKNLEEVSLSEIITILRTTFGSEFKKVSETKYEVRRLYCK